MSSMLSPSALNKIPIFCDLTDEQLSQINRFLYHRIFPAETTLIAAEQPGEVVYIILGGTVKVQIIQPNGRNVILALLGAGQIVGEMSLADSLGYSATVVTHEQAALLSISHAKFQEFQQLMPKLMHNLVRILSVRLRLANAQIQSLAALDVCGRVAHQLLAFAREYGEPRQSEIFIPIPLTQADLAELVGASRVRVNQILSDYRTNELISIDQSHCITIRKSVELLKRCHPSAK